MRKRTACLWIGRSKRDHYYDLAMQAIRTIGEEEAATARKTLGLPAKPPAKKRRKPKAKAV